MTYFTAIAKHLSIVWLLLLIGCQYKPDGEFFEEVDATKIEMPTILLQNIDSMIFLHEKTHFIYRITTSRKRFQTEVYFDDQKIYSSSTSFSLDPQDYEDGRYTLIIRTITGSGTGSLADKIIRCSR